MSREYKVLFGEIPTIGVRVSGLEPVYDSLYENISKGVTHGESRIVSLPPTYGVTLIGGKHLMESPHIPDDCVPENVIALPKVREAMHEADSQINVSEASLTCAAIRCGKSLGRGEATTYVAYLNDNNCLADFRAKLRESIGLRREKSESNIYKVPLLFVMSMGLREQKYHEEGLEKVGKLSIGGIDAWIAKNVRRCWLKKGVTSSNKV